MLSAPAAPAALPTPPMRRRLPRLAWLLSPVIILAVLTSGCLQSEATLHLESDGSGTLEMTLLVNEDMAMMMGGLSDGDESAPIMSDAELIAKGSELGEDVRFVSSEPVERDGFQGIRAVYEFDDVRKIRMEMSPDGDSPAGKKEDPITFEFTPAGIGPARVVVHLPSDAALDVDEEMEAPSAPEQTPSPEEIEQLRAMFGGLRIAAAIEVAGSIVKTDSPYRDGSTVTLLEMDFDQLLQDFDKLTELAAMGQPKDLGELTQRLQGVPGIKVNPTETITIEFEAK